MIERPIPATGEMLPVIGLGSWIQFDVDTDSPENANLSAVLHQMKERGAKLIDSSPMYGKSEQKIGELTTASGYADSFFYATKVWTNGEQNGIAQMEASLQKMNRKTMDLMQVHNFQDWKTHIITLNKWKAEGRIRYTGVTHYRDSTHDELEQIVRARAVDFVQCNYSIITRNAEKSLLPACKDHGVAVLINEPMEKGALFRTVRGKPLPPWVAEFEITSWAAFFLKYILAETAVTCVIPGTSNPDHMRDILGAGFGPLPDNKTRMKMRALIDNI